jgi:predicted phage tail protein
MWKTFKQVVYDCFTNPYGDYDPARVIGYLIVILGALEFLGISMWQYAVYNKFDSTGFAAGLASIGGTLAAAGVGVWIKSDAEKPSPTKAAAKAPDLPTSD